MDTKKQRNEREVVLLTNRKMKRAISGLLAAVTILSAFIQPASVLAEDPEPMAYEAEHPALETARTELAEDEIVTAGDYEVESGSSFDVEHDFSGMEIPEEKVTVKFHEAKNQSGQDFDMDSPDTYKAIYVTRGCAGYVEWLGQKENPAGKGWAAGGWYRVRKSWADVGSQKGAFKELGNAKECADGNPGYSVFDESGKTVYRSGACDHSVSGWGRSHGTDG